MDLTAIIQAATQRAHLTHCPECTPKSAHACQLLTEREFHTTAATITAALEHGTAQLVHSLWAASDQRRKQLVESRFEPDASAVPATELLRQWWRFWEQSQHRTVLPSHELQMATIALLAATAAQEGRRVSRPGDL